MNDAWFILWTYFLKVTLWYPTIFPLLFQLSGPGYMGRARRTYQYVNGWCTWFALHQKSLFNRPCEINRFKISVMMMLYIKMKNSFSMRLNSLRLYISPPWVIRQRFRKHNDATHRFPWQYVCDGCCCHGVNALIGKDCCNILQLAGETFLYGVMRRLAFGIGKATKSNVPYLNRSGHIGHIS